MGVIWRICAVVALEMMEEAGSAASQHHHPTHQHHWLGCLVSAWHGVGIWKAESDPSNQGHQQPNHGLVAAHHSSYVAAVSNQALHAAKQLTYCDSSVCVQTLGGLQQSQVD